MLEVSGVMLNVLYHLPEVGGVASSSGLVNMLVHKLKYNNSSKGITYLILNFRKQVMKISMGMSSNKLQVVTMKSTWLSTTQ